MDRHLEQLARVAAATRSAVIITDREGLTVWVNDGFTELSGYALDEVVGKKPGSVLRGPDTSREVTERVGAAIRAGQAIDVAIVNYSKSGRKYWIEMKIERLLAKNGELEGFMAIEAEITERVKTDEELQLLTSRFELATRAAHIGIYDYDAKTGEFWWNDIAYEIFRQDPRTFKPTLDSWLALVHPDDRAVVRSEYEGRRGMPRIDRIHYRVVDPDGTVRNIFSRGAPSAGTGRLSGSILDITIRISAEERERALQQQLRESAHQAGMAEIATGVLHNVGNVLNSLGVANSMVTKIHKSMRLERLSQAAALITEHRATLPAFLTEDARGKHLPDYLAALAAQITSSDQRLRSEFESIGTLINHLREIVSAQQSVATIGGLSEYIDLRELAKAALLVQGASVRHVQIEEHFDAVPPVQNDRHKLLQILVNYVRNALDAVEAARPQPARIELRLTRDAGHAIFSVTDSGIGMTPEVLGRLWQFGFTTKPQGHGFGLHNCANAANSVGAQVGATSDGPGKGSCFTLRVPFHQDEQIATGAAA